MTDPEDTIERVLAGLREAEAPAGMEARILSALEARHAERQANGHGQIGLTPWMKLGRGLRLEGVVALAGVAVLAVIAVSPRVSLHKMRPVARDGRGNGMAVAAGGAAGAEEAVPQRLKPRDSSGVYGTAQAALLSKTGPASIAATGDAAADGSINERPILRNGGRNLPQARGTEGGLDYDSLALSEMLAPSRPAPPLPLTHQEKLLAEVVRKGDPEQVADLKPEVRERQIEIARAEFHDFFDPPPMKDNE